MAPRYKIFIVLGIIALAGVIVFLNIAPSKYKGGDLVICDKEKEIWSLMDKGTTKDVEEKNKIIQGFYISKNSLHLEGWAKRVTEKLELTDFIEGYFPPTPLLGLQQKFQDGDLIELEIGEYANLSTGETGILASTILVLRVKKAEKLSLPTKSEFLNKAQQVFYNNANTIFRCAGSKTFDFPSFEETDHTVTWDRVNQQALITYQGTKDHFGNVKVVNVGIILDKYGEPVSILVGSKVVPLE